MKQYFSAAIAFILVQMSASVARSAEVTAEQETVVKNLYNASLVVINIGDTFTTGPEEAAFVINELIEPVSVIPFYLQI